MNFLCIVLYFILNVEIMTAYPLQILALTSPMVGNYGVPNPSTMDAYGLPEFFESSRIHAAALLVQDYSLHYSHWNAHMSLGDWLKQEASLHLTLEHVRHLTFESA